MCRLLWPMKSSKKSKINLFLSKSKVLHKNRFIAECPLSTHFSASTFISWELNFWFMNFRARFKKINRQTLILHAITWVITNSLISHKQFSIMVELETRKQSANIVYTSMRYHMSSFRHDCPIFRVSSWHSIISRYFRVFWQNIPFSITLPQIKELHIGGNRFVEKGRWICFSRAASFYSVLTSTSITWCILSNEFSLSNN